MNIRLRHILEMNPPKSQLAQLPLDTEVTFAPMEALAEGMGGLDVSRTGVLGELNSGSYSYFAEDDVLVAKVTPCFENGKKAIAKGLSNGVGFATSEVHVLRANRRRLDTNYLRYLLCSEDFRGAGLASMTGSGGLRRVSDRAILDYRLPIEAIGDQKVIADFLDAETARIDQLIEKKHQAIKLREEEHEAFVTRVVLGGLNLGATTQRSSLPWLPVIPTHWTTRRMAVLFREINEAGRDGQPILSVSIHDGVSDRELDAEERGRKTNHIADKKQYKQVTPGDLVYNMMRAWQGGFGAVKASGLVSPAYVTLRPITSVATSYVEATLRTKQGIEEMRRLSKGITDFRLRLYWENLRQFAIPVPPVEEQQSIMAVVSGKAVSVEAIRNKIENSVERLRELRSALITAAVTGQLDTKSWHKHGDATLRVGKLEVEATA